MTNLETREVTRPEEEGNAALAAVDPRLPGDFAILRVALWVALVGYAGLGLLGFAVFAGFWPPPGPELSAAEIADYFADRHTGIMIGMVLMAACGPFYLVWSLVLSRVISRIEGPMGILSSVEMLGGMLTGLVTFTPAVFWITAAFRVDTVSAETVQMLYDLGWFFFDLTFVCSALQGVAVGIAILRDRRAVPLLPRWLAWLAFMTAGSYCVLPAMPFFLEGPVAWNGLLSFWAVFVLFFIFTFALTPYATKALRAIEREIVLDGTA